MDIDDLQGLGIILLIIFGMLSLMVVFIIGIQALDIKVFNNVPVEIYVNGELFYKGINGCVNVKSSGYTTTIKTKNGFLCFFPDKFYSGEGVVIK